MLSLLINIVALSMLAASLQAAEKIVLNGPLTQGALIIGTINDMPLGEAAVFLNDEQIYVSPEGSFVIGFGRDASVDQRIELKVGDELVASKRLEIQQRRYKTERVEGVPQKTVTPRPENLKRIRAEAALVAKARQKKLELNHYQLKFKPPMAASVTGIYGSQRVYNGTPKRPHYGVDYAAPVGALVYAPAGGIVTMVHDDMYYSGGTLIVDHGYGVSSSFLHLSEVLVKEGDVIHQGDILAKVGKGGRATGPHLDWRMNWFKVRIDPQLVLELDLPE